MCAVPRKPFYLVAGPDSFVNSCASDGAPQSALSLFPLMSGGNEARGASTAASHVSPTVYFRDLIRNIYDSLACGHPLMASRRFRVFFSPSVFKGRFDATPGTGLRAALMPWFFP